MLNLVNLEIGGAVIQTPPKILQSPTSSAPNEVDADDTET